MAGGYGASPGIMNTHIATVVTPEVMRQFMAQNPASLLVTPKPVVPIGTYAKLDGLPLVHVQTQQLWVLMRSEFC
jgi:hypothetical protein